jgi:hypothetical protein
MTGFSCVETIGNNAAIIIPVLLVLIGLLILYFVLLVRAIIQMLHYKVSGVLLTFSFISLIPVPFMLIMGITILIIWRSHKRDIQSEKIG